VVAGFLRDWPPDILLLGFVGSSSVVSARMGFALSIFDGHIAVLCASTRMIFQHIPDNCTSTFDNQPFVTNQCIDLVRVGLGEADPCGPIFPGYIHRSCIQSSSNVRWWYAFAGVSVVIECTDESGIRWTTYQAIYLFPMISVSMKIL
jgi:hypothetical protein